MQGADSANKHFGQIIASTHAHPVNQRKHQGITPRCRRATKIIGIEQSGLMCEMTQLAGRHLLQGGFHVAQRIQPSQLIQKRFQVFLGRTLGQRLDGLKGTLAMRIIGGKQTVEESTPIICQGRIDTCVQAVLRRGRCRLSDVVQGRESRQFVSSKNQFLNAALMTSMRWSITSAASYAARTAMRCASLP